MTIKKNPSVDDSKTQKSNSNSTNSNQTNSSQSSNTPSSSSSSNVPATTPSAASKLPATADLASGRKAGVTRLKIRYNCGYGNSLSIRGKGANLSWEKGQPLKNLKHDEWVWETTVPFSHCEFKVLINDVHYEQGNNHHLQSGESSEYTPRF